jgi:hypothetical protein
MKDILIYVACVLTATSRARVPKKGEENDAHKINEKRANTI